MQEALLAFYSGLSLSMMWSFSTNHWSMFTTLDIVELHNIYPIAATILASDVTSNEWKNDIKVEYLYDKIMLEKND